MVFGKSLSDYDTTIKGDDLDGRYVHFQSLRYPERWVRGYTSSGNLEVKTYAEREVYDESATQFKVISLDLTFVTGDHAFHFLKYFNLV